jgi:carbonyl reductase 1
MKHPEVTYYNCQWRHRRSQQFFIVLALLSNMIVGLSTTGQVVLVTGANKGIGKEICRLLAKDPSVSATILACRSLERAEEAMQELQADGCDNLYCVQYDLSKSEEMAPKVRDFVHANFGRLDVLINNAAICFNDPTLYGLVEYTPFQQQVPITIETNFFGTWRLTQALLPLLQKSDSPPRLINIVSYAGRLAILKSPDLVQKFTSPQLSMPELEFLVRDFVAAVERGTHVQDGWPNTAYGLSKLALIAMTRVLAREHNQQQQHDADANDNENSDNDSKLVCYSVDPGYCATDQNQYQGNRPASRGAETPYKLTTTITMDLEGDDKKNSRSGLHWFDGNIVEW